MLGSLHQILNPPLASSKQILEEEEEVMKGQVLLRLCSLSMLLLSPFAASSAVALIFSKDPAIAQFLQNNHQDLLLARLVSSVL